ncbi:serine hydrolase domain-containing protein [Micromonospora echinaurantiaca]|uniref:serine hydrolase domain-containing protein n=1 Tax=Micromonospora echinaurantiaca TaxID=47857 RepID=UPI0034385F31
MNGTTVSRRTFGRLVGAAGAGALGAGALAAAPAAAAPQTWSASGTAVAALRSFDDTMKSYMLARGISAGQLAVTYRGRLVLARGYGNNSPQLIQPTSLFRVASLSKSLTAAAIVRLAQDGRLSLGDPVGKFVDLTPPAGQSVDPRLGQVTLWRLLQHTGGWDRDATNFDPLFKDRIIARALGVPMELRHADVIRFMSGQPLLHDPGATVSYSNYGYLLAGRVVEAVTGMPYETYVKQTLLAPLGVTRMANGWTIARHSGEVGYQSQYTGTTVLDDSGATVAAPYGTFSMRLHDANGGWIASAVDMVRWASAFDAGSTLLNSTSLSRIWAVPQPTGVNSNGWYYGLGWAVRPVSGGTGRNTWHTGSLPGNYSLLVRTYDGMSWAALFNQRDDESGLGYGEIDPLLWQAARAVTSWPTHNFWSKYYA